MDRPNKESVFFFPSLAAKVVPILARGTASGLKSKKRKK